MPHTIAKNRGGIVIHLLEPLSGDDLDLIQDQFDRAVAEGAAYVVLDFEQLERVTPLAVAMIGTLRLQSRRRNCALELRNVSPRHMKVMAPQPAAPAMTQRAEDHCGAGQIM
jgi:anti-anti-sigma regulatory factor